MKVARVLPCLDVTRGRVVKGTRFLDLQDAGDPVELAARYDADGADELVFLDVTASSDGRDTTVSMVRRVAEKVFIPFTVGGGIRTAADARRMLRAGADKVGVNTAAFERPDLIADIADEFGSQCAVCAVDAKRRHSATADGVPPSWPDASPSTSPFRPRSPVWPRSPSWEVFLNGGRTPTGRDAVAWAVDAAAMGAGEILLTSMDRDGTGDGFDLELIRAVTDAVDVPVIASGGVGTLDHLADGILVGGADAVLAASIFHFGAHTIGEAKDLMTRRGIVVRPVGEAPAAATERSP